MPFRTTALDLAVDLEEMSAVVLPELAYYCLFDDLLRQAVEVLSPDGFLCFLLIE